MDDDWEASLKMKSDLGILTYKIESKPINDLIKDITDKIYNIQKLCKNPIKNIKKDAPWWN